MTGETGLGLAAPLIQTFWIDQNGKRATPSCGRDPEDPSGVLALAGRAVYPGLVEKICPDP